MVDWVCRSLGGSLIPRLHLTTLLHRLWLQTNLYCADSGSKQISTAQTRAPNDVIYSRWQRPYWDVYSLHFSIVEGSGDASSIFFYSLWFHPVLVKHMIDQAKGIFAEGQHLHRLIIHISLKAKNLFSGCVLTN